MSLRSALENAGCPDYHELAMRLLFCTTIVCADTYYYRIREIEIYHGEDPYTHQGDEQLSSAGGWYFHRTKPGGAWKGGTFRGLDLTFAPVGTAGGVLIRGISQVSSPQHTACDDDVYRYIDGSCNCVKEFLKACGVSEIKRLVEKPNFKWNALAQDSILRLIEHEPIGVSGDPKKNLNPNAEMEWRACSRIGLSEPNKIPEKAEARKKYHLAKLRFLQAPYETKKEKTKIKNSTVKGVFSEEELEKLNKQNSKCKAATKKEADGDIMPPPSEKTKESTKPVQKAKTWLREPESSSGEEEEEPIMKPKRKKKIFFEDSDEEVLSPKKKRRRLKITLHGLFEDNDKEEHQTKKTVGSSSEKNVAKEQEDLCDTSDEEMPKKVAEDHSTTKKENFGKLLKATTNLVRAKKEAEKKKMQDQHKATPKMLFGESSDDNSSDEEEWDPAYENESIDDVDGKPATDQKKGNASKGGVLRTKNGEPAWQYWLDIPMDGKSKGWHPYEMEACSKLEGFLKSKGEQISRTTWHLKSGHFSYAVDISKMTQTNMSSGTVRPIRRVPPGETCDMSQPPIFITSKESSQLVLNDSGSTKGKTKAVEYNGPPSPHESKAGKSNHLGVDDDDLKLQQLFVGKHAHSWEKVLTDVIEVQPNAHKFIGPNRSKNILPIREMTFRALMAVSPEENNLVVFGQGPYLRVESASGIAMFDTLIKDWDSPQFGKTVSMRCIAKAAAVAKGIVGQDANVNTLRKKFKENNIVSPPEWFQGMLAQGVLLLNASLTIGGSDMSIAHHNNFWKPVMRAIIREILKTKMKKFPPGSPGRRIAFLWWGKEALKTKKFLSLLLAGFDKKIEITHIEHVNPAAQGDKFSQPPNHFEAVNQALVNGGLEPVDWLPNKNWLMAHHLDEHAAFITDTQELHQMYLDRLQAGLVLTDLEPIVGIMSLPIPSLPEACKELGFRSAAASALSTVQKFKEKALDENEKGAIYLYTTNVLYRRLNEALRKDRKDRGMLCPYFHYLRLFLESYAKMNASKSDQQKTTMLYRGINKDLSEQYKTGAQVVWWNVSSCTPKLGVAKNFAGGNGGGGGGGGSKSSGTLFYVKSRTAVPIMHLSAYQHEEEYVLAPGTVLKVESVIKKPNKATEIHLEEIQGKRWVN